MTQKIKVAVAGAGHLGNYHMQKIMANPDAELVAVIDISAEKQKEIADKMQIPCFASLEEVPDLDALIVATPTSNHYQSVMEGLERGLHILVEKPISASLSEAEEMVSAAAAKKKVLQVGHTERFNPAISAVLDAVSQPGYIVCERLAPFSGRSTDVDVVLDLMIHDLDIVAALMKTELADTQAVGVPVITRSVDMASARLTFADGAVAQLSAGRASLEASRKIRLFTTERYVSIDCATREVKAVRRELPDNDVDWPKISGEPFEIGDGDALQLQDDDFIASIIEGRTPRVDGHAGVAALKLALAVKEAMTTPLPS